jgi:NAD(P)-dependent dehydrogenase (short-subunit alcohol dehydrogenase family)
MMKTYSKNLIILYLINKNYKQCAKPLSKIVIILIRIVFALLNVDYFALYCSSYHKTKNMNIIITGASRLQKLKSYCEKNKTLSEIVTLPFDLENGDYETLSTEIRSHMQDIHILVNNAGALVNKKFGHLTSEDFDHMMNVNVKSAFLLTQSLLPLFDEKAHVLNISSMGGYQGSAKFPGLSLYSASKGALAILSECMAEELKGFGISVNCLALGAAQTEMLSEAFPGYKAPLSAEEMANYIAEFALNGHRYYNGKILPLSLSTP